MCLGIYTDSIHVLRYIRTVYMYLGIYEQYTREHNTLSQYHSCWSPDFNVGEVRGGGGVIISMCTPNGPNMA